MKLRFKILIAIIIFWIVSYGAAFVSLKIEGKAIVVDNLSRISGKKVSVGSLSLSPNFSLVIKDLEIEGVAKVEKIFIAPNLFSFLSGRIGLSRVLIIGPEITYERVPMAVSVTQMPEKTVPSAADAVGNKEEQKLHLFIKRFKIKKGTLNFIDKTVSPEGLKVIIKDIDFNLNNIYLYPFSAVANFELMAKIPWQKGEAEGRILAEGWVNLLKKDINATLNIEGIDGIYLYPYYSSWVDLQKARIETAKLNFKGTIQGLNNEITAQCHLELTDIVRKPRPSDEPQEKEEKITDAVLGILKSLNQGKIEFNFTIKTKLNCPQFKFGDIKSAFEDKLYKGRKGEGVLVEDVLTFPGKVIGSTVKGASEVSRAVIEGAFAVGNEIKKGVEGAFKKEN